MIFVPKSIARTHDGLLIALVSINYEKRLTIWRTLAWSCDPRDVRSTTTGITWFDCNPFDGSWVTWLSECGIGRFEPETNCQIWTDKKVKQYNFNLQFRYGFYPNLWFYHRWEIRLRQKVKILTFTWLRPICNPKHMPICSICNHRTSN